MESENTTSLHTDCKRWSEPSFYFLKQFNSILDAIQVASPLDLYVKLLLPLMGTEPRNGSVRRFPFVLQKFHH